MKYFRWLPIFAFLVLTSGCYAPSLIEFDGLKPAEISIPSTVHTLTVVSRGDLDSTYKAAFDSSGMKAEFKRDSLMSKQAVIGCSDVLVESPRFELFNPVIKRTLTGANSGTSNKIPWDDVRTIAGDPPLDAVLSFDIGTVNDSLRGGSYTSYQFVVFVKTTWRLYSLRDYQVQEFNFADTVTFDIDSPYETDFNDQLIDCIRNAMYETGARTARRLAPWWNRIERNYFTMGPRNFYSGAEYISIGKWREAAEIFRPFTMASRKMVAAKACFNMAVISEMGNNIPAAIEWLKQSEKLGMHQYYIDEYEPKLLKRKAESDKLDEQMK